MSIESREAAAALSDIEDIARRVRQSRFYNLVSLMLILWGALTAAGYVASYALPPYAAYAWIAIYVAGLAGSFVISAMNHAQSGVRTFDLRIFLAFLVFFAFGFFTAVWLGHFTPRQLGVFWPLYFMLVYTIVGLWLGWAFVAIGIGISALALIGYAWSGAWFELWMAAVNGGGLILGGLWMRRS